jgi:predicted RND superfamily exporter protein
MAGFGALMLAHHTALIGFGTILFLGILASAAAALYLLPLVVRAFGLGDRQGPDRR